MKWNQSLLGTSKPTLKSGEGPIGLMWQHRSRSAHFTTPSHCIWDSHVKCNEILWKFCCFRWSAGPEFWLGIALSTQTISALLTGFQVLLRTMHWCNCLSPDYRNREKNVNLSEDSRSHYLIHRAHGEDRHIHSPFTNIKTANKCCSISPHFTWREKIRRQFPVNA